MARSLVLAVLLPLAACSGVKPFEYQTANDPPGPGLFTGPEGKFVILGR
jgi:hypothetical protein